jgi:hypothetical protein
VPSRRLALAFVLALGAVLGSVLGSQSARVPLRTPFVPREARTTPVTAALEGREGRRGSVVYRLELRAPDGAELLEHEELQLFLDAGEPALPLAGAELRLRGHECAFVAPGRDALAAREATAFRRSNACRGAPLAAGPATLELTVELGGEGPLALLAFEPPEGAEPAPLQVPPTRFRPIPLDVRGAFVDYPETAPRVVLLAYMWRNSPGVGWLAALVVLALLLACGGCLVFPTGPLAAASGPELPRVARGALGAALLAGSLALLHTTLEPPLSGPDEPYHLLGFAELVGDEALGADTVAWMGETHLWRTRQQPGERFRTIDVGRPYVVEDDQLRPTEVAQRSAVLARLWSATASLARDRPAHHALLALRLLNALAFALAVGVAAGLALTLVAEPFPQWLVFPFLFVPALPFFATHVSETAILTAIHVLLGASVAVVCLDGGRAHWAGLPLGLATGLMLACGRSPWPLVALVGAVLMGRVLLGGSACPSLRRETLAFWGGFGIGTMVFFLLLSEPYRLMTETYATHFALFLPAALRQTVRELLIRPQIMAALVWGGVLLGAALELALVRPGRWLASRLGSVARLGLARAATAAAAAIVLSFGGSLFLSYPQLPTDATYVMPASERVSAVLATMATMFRLTEPNFLLASSFWVGFGWLDTMPGAAFQGALVALVGLALVSLLLELGRHGQVRRLLWLVVIAAGAAAALVLYTVSTQDRVSTLVGRHLIGWYLAVLAVIGGALTLDRRAAGPSADAAAASRDGSWRAAALLLVAGAAHAYCLSFILRRYF